MSKVIKYGSDMTAKLLSGVEKTTELVAQTMGPVASNVIINDHGYPRVTKDGITVIRAVEFEDKFENTAAALIREASSKTNTQSGDGTTGTAVLLQSIYRNGLKHTAVGGNKIQIRNGIAKAANKAIETLNATSKKIQSREDIRNVAKISSNHSDEIADVLSEVFDKIGLRGVIKVEEGSTTETSSKIVEGCQYETGYMSPYFSTNEHLEADLQDPWTLFCGKKLANLQELLPMLQAVSKTGKPIFIMCEDMEGDALSTIVYNRINAGLPICVVKSPSFGENRNAILEDLALLTHSKVVSDTTQTRIEEAIPGSVVLGRAKRIIVTRDTTTIIGGSASKEEIDARVKQLDSLIENSKDEYDREQYEDRRAKLDGGVAIISVGGKTTSELKEKKDLVDDAFNAVKAALKNGVVAGGGIALLKLQQTLDSWLNANTDFIGDEKIGARLMLESLDAPIKTILKNAGESVDLIVARILENSDPSYGYDVLNKKYCNMIDAGIIDPASVIISEVENASSIAGLLLTTSGAIVNIPEESNTSGCSCGH